MRIEKKMYKKLNKIRRDGNCLFRCLSLSHHGHEKYHRKMRTEIVQYIVENWTDFEPYIIGDSSYSIKVTKKHDYVTHMSSGGVFGGETELTAFVKMNPQYSVHISHRKSENSKTYGRGPKSIFLKYSGPYDTGHYDVLIPASTSSKFNTTSNTEPNNPKKSAFDEKKRIKALKFLGDIQNLPELIIEFETENVDVKCHYCASLRSKCNPLGSRNLPTPIIEFQIENVNVKRHYCVSWRCKCNP